MQRCCVRCLPKLLHESGIAHWPRDGSQGRQVSIATIRLGQQQDHDVHRLLIDCREVDWPRQPGEQRIRGLQCLETCMR